MFCHFRSKIRVCGNRCQSLTFKDKDDRKMYTQKRMGYKTAIPDFWNFVNFGKFKIFSTFFYF